MSTDAWARLVNSCGMASEEEWMELIGAALVEVQTETRRRAAAMVRAEFYLPGDGCSGLVKEIADKIEKG